MSAILSLAGKELKAIAGLGLALILLFAGVDLLNVIQRQSGVVSGYINYISDQTPVLYVWGVFEIFPHEYIMNAWPFILAVVFAYTIAVEKRMSTDYTLLSLPVRRGFAVVRKCGVILLFGVLIVVIRSVLRSSPVTPFIQSIILRMSDLDPDDFFLRAKGLVPSEAIFYGPHNYYTIRLDIVIVGVRELGRLFLYCSMVSFADGVACIRRNRRVVMWVSSLVFVIVIYYILAYFMFYRLTFTGYFMFELAAAVFLLSGGAILHAYYEEV